MDDRALVEQQLGRPPRAFRRVAARCPDGSPAVTEQWPYDDAGDPFPTTYYLTCPRAASMIGTLEGSGLMKEMEARLGEDDGLAASYAAAHRSYLADRSALGEVPEIEGISAGGMPNRVKCLHVLVGHALAAGPGVNPIGDEVLTLIHDEWRPDRCTC